MPPAHLKVPDVPRERLAGCTGKVAYLSAEDARNSVRHAPMKLRAYPCEHCKGWHITSMRRRDKR